MSIGNPFRTCVVPFSFLLTSHRIIPRDSPRLQTMSKQPKVPVTVPSDAPYSINSALRQVTSMISQTSPQTSTMAPPPKTSLNIPEAAGNNSHHRLRQSGLVHERGIGRSQPVGSGKAHMKGGPSLSSVAERPHQSIPAIWKEAQSGLLVPGAQKKLCCWEIESRRFKAR